MKSQTLSFGLCGKGCLFIRINVFSSPQNVRALAVLRPSCIVRGRLPSDGGFPSSLVMMALTPMSATVQHGCPREGERRWRKERRTQTEQGSKGWCGGTAKTCEDRVVA